MCLLGVRCRAPVSASSLVAPDKTLLRMLGDLRVRCTKRSLGCDWVGPRENVVGHLAHSCAHAAGSDGTMHDDDLAAAMARKKRTEQQAS